MKFKVNDKVKILKLEKVDHYFFANNIHEGKIIEILEDNKYLVLGKCPDGSDFNQAVHEYEIELNKIAISKLYKVLNG